MKNTSLVLPATLAVLLLTGQGCPNFFNLGAKKPTASAPDGGVFRTTDLGATWTNNLAVPTGKGVGSLNTTDILSLTFDPQDARTLYAGTKFAGMVYSLDKGETWLQTREPELQSGMVPSVAVSYADVCTIYAAKPNRLVKTTDCFRSAQTDLFVEIRPKTELKKLAVDWYAPDTVWVGESNGDVQKSLDGGKSWARVLNTRGDGVTDILVSKSDSRIVLVGTSRYGFWKTIDGGANWKQVDKPLKSFKDGDEIHRFVQDKTGKEIVMATSFGLLRSKDLGETWEQIALTTGPGQVNIDAVAMDPEDPKQLRYVSGKSMYSSENSGQTWTTHDFSSSRIATAMLIDPSDDRVLYVGVVAPVKK